uniref:Tetratricopeptide repeat protein 21B n=1 Tax=Macrostomum lignano TaxID=282301 RepID=A0A1I8J5Y6_9PLAT
MSEADREFFSLAFYYFRERYWRHVITACQDAGRRYGPADPLVKLWESCALIEEDRVQEALRELESLRSKPDMNVAALLAMAHAHRKSRQPDLQAIKECESAMREERKRAGERGLLYGGLVVVLQDRHDKAKEYIDRLLKMSPGCVEGQALRGWADLHSKDEAVRKSAGASFDKAVEASNGRFPDALLGKAKSLEARRNFSAALEVVNQLIVAFPRFLPGLIEKMRVQLELQDWDQMLDTASRCLDSDPSCIPAMEFQLLNLLCREGSYTQATSSVSDLLQAMDRYEPKNVYQYSRLASLFSRVAIRQPTILQQTGYLQERALALDKDNAEQITRMGHQLLMQGKVRDAIKTFRRALDQDESSVTALQGIIRCQLAEDLLQEAASQLDFLKEVQSSLGSTGDLSFLLAVLARKRGAPPNKILAHLDDAIQQHFASFKGLALGPDYYHSLNPDFLIQLVHEYLVHAPQKPSAAGGGQVIDPVLRRCTQLLDPLTRAMPGLLEALYQMAKIRYLLGDNESALAKLETCIDNDPAFSAAFLLKAQILVHQGNLRLAEQALDNALSHNFEVRDSPLYHLTLARVLKGQKRLDEAIQSLQAAVKLISSAQQAAAKKGAQQQQQQQSQQSQQMTSADRLSVYLELAEVYRLADRPHEATKVLQDAQNDFAGSPEEVRVTISNADLALQRGDIEMALGTLRTTPETDLLLADAYMAIQEPEKAIEIYESVLKRNSRDAALATKMGQALVKCHSYKKAVTYYEHALKSGQTFLRFDLAQLLLRLKQYDKAEKTLAPAEETSSEDPVLAAKLLHLKSQVFVQQGRTQEAAEALNSAKTLLTKALRRGVENADEEQLRQLKERIHLEAARLARDRADLDSAKQLYADAGPTGGLELVRLLMSQDDLDTAQQHAMRLVAKNPEDDQAVFLLAELLCQQGDLQQAAYHYRQLLESRPDNYPAVARLIDVLRRLGRLEEAAPFVLAQSARARVDGGFCYCRGLYEWHCGNAGEALRQLNRARLDSDFQQEAVFCMRLLHELKPRSGPGGNAARLRVEYLKAMVLVAGKQKAGADKAVQIFNQMLSQDKLYVPAIYGLAAAHMVAKNSAKARSTLKPLVTVTWSLEFADELEKGWLLLADMSVQSGGSRSEGAQELLAKVLQHNKACYKAYEYLGFLMEKEQNYKDAARNYELAWRYSNQTNPAIGFKLAFNYLKSKKLVEAVDICHVVLKNHPTYPKIKKEILDKARQQIRA